MPDERDRFVAMLRKHGTRRPGPGTPAGTQVPNGACWDAAWAAAEANNTFYVEGICLLPPKNKGEAPGYVNAHAWEERQTPFGVQIIEHTRGFEHVHTYVGLRINRAEARPAIGFTEERASILEIALHAGWPVDDVLRTFTHPSRP